MTLDTLGLLHPINEPLLVEIAVRLNTPKHVLEQFRCYLAPATAPLRGPDTSALRRAAMESPFPEPDDIRAFAHLRRAYLTALKTR